ncbi:MAG: type transport system permease protein [Actinomycetota bacterium]|jgi:ABC transporter DrrB family efflux protein|nr:type transport system permease protein [Actinomycetota bacterium]
MRRVVLAFADGAVVAKRNLIKIKRVPDILIFTTMSPIMFVLLFGFVFGSSIHVPGVNYREYLIAGVFAQTVIFGAGFTGSGLAEDMTKGIIDRFRSLPMARSAVLIGRTGSDVLYNSISILVMSLTGLIVGWRIRTSPQQAITGFLILLLFSYAISWVMAYVGLKVSSVQVFQNASFMFIFPVTFIANTFVRSDLLPGPLRVFADWNPVSSVAQAVREAFGNTGSLPQPQVWSLRNPLAYSLIWVVVILIVFVPLSIRQYNQSSKRD